MAKLSPTGCPSVTPCGCATTEPEAPGQLVAGAIMAITQLGAAISAVIIQRSAAVAPLPGVSMALLQRVIEIAASVHRAVQRNLLR